ncbi:MAG TPA: PHP domain-containing protein [candidate division Zixibacteria bacterium]|nr:PHP domain-containing protein [candidate division Zixibacteria bacterium]
MINEKRDKEKTNSFTFLIDAHIHTNQSPCASITLEETLIRLSGIVDAITVTDHDFIFEASNEVLNALQLKYNIKVLTPAVEISSLQGHILAYGIESVPSNNSDAKEVIEMIHSEGGIAVAAHPFALLGLDDLIFSLDLDALEINGSRSSRINQLAKESAEMIGIPLIGGSDSHTLYHIGTCVTEFFTMIETAQDLISAVKKGKCRPLFLTHRGRKH